MNVSGIFWLGVETPRYEEMVRFVRRILSLKVIFEGKFGDAETTEFECRNGTRFQVTRGSQPVGPSPLFEVDDLAQARREIEAAGIEILGDNEGDGTWKWFCVRAPDRNTYEIGTRLHRKA